MAGPGRTPHVRVVLCQGKGEVLQADSRAELRAVCTAEAIPNRSPRLSSSPGEVHEIGDGLIGQRGIAFHGLAVVVPGLVHPPRATKVWATRAYVDGSVPPWARASRYSARASSASPLANAWSPLEMELPSSPRGVHPARRRATAAIHTTGLRSALAQDVSKRVIRIGVKTNEVAPKVGRDPM